MKPKRKVCAICGGRYWIGHYAAHKQSEKHQVAAYDRWEQRQYDDWRYGHRRRQRR